MTVGRDTFIHHMLEVCNFDNAFQDHRRYPEVNIHQLPELDLLLLSSEPYPFKKQHMEEISFPKDKIVLVDGEFFSWYGSRVRLAFKYFQELRLRI